MKINNPVMALVWLAVFGLVVLLAIKATGTAGRKAASAIS